MIVTETEAKTKRCQESFPAAQGLSADGSAYASSWSYPPPPMGGGMLTTMAVVHTAPSLCVGSACMAWRWTADTKTTVNEGETSGITRACGYCGKAGRP